ncbi:hypothetical protein MMC28_009565 [Mycoblastus sanguinarius]|nr:hypothetical protein [Mycoblastus sanguinarius]
MSLVQQPRSIQNFLSMPREIRDLIYLALLQPPTEPPSAPENAGPRFEERCGDPTLRMFYSVELFPASAHLNLLRCNRQIGTEFQDVLARHGASQPEQDFRLDLMTQRDKIWPTWIHFPGSTERIRNLDVDLRVFDETREGFVTDGGPGSSYRRLWWLIDRLFKYGPRFISKTPVPYSLHVETLCLNISFERVAPSKNGRASHGALARLFWWRLCGVVQTGRISGKVSRLKMRIGHDVSELEVEGDDIEWNRWR